MLPQQCFCNNVSSFAGDSTGPLELAKPFETMRELKSKLRL